MKPCTQCGKCCLHNRYMNTLTIGGDDVKRWQRERRGDILARISILGPDDNPYADAWFTPGGNEVKRCPFVRKQRGTDRYACTIYDTRPEVCRGYPYDIEQMDGIGCEMLEPGDTDADL